MQNTVPRITFILKKDKAFENNTYPIYTRIYKNKKTLRKKTEYSTTIDSWNVKRNEVRKTDHNYIEINAGLAAIKSKYLNEFNKLKNENIKISLNEIKRKNHNNDNNISFSTFLLGLIAEKRKINYGYSKKFEQLYNLLHNAYYFFKNNFEYKGQKVTLKNKIEIEFNDINNEFINYVGTFLDIKGSQSYNTHKFYFKTFKTSLNEAKKKGYCEREFNPFLDFKIKKTKSNIVKKDYLTKDEIYRIEEADLCSNIYLKRVRAFFLISYYLRGLNIADLVKLKKSDVVEGRIKYNRTKTHQAINSIPVKYAEKYLKDVEGNGKYLVDILKDNIKTTESIYHKRRLFNKWLNDGLNELAAKCEIEKKITTKTARDSYAMNVYVQSGDINKVKQVLCHKDINTTISYINTMDDKSIDVIDDEVHKR